MFWSLLEKSLLMAKTFNFVTPLNLNLWWNMGFLMIFVVLMQILSGIFLSCILNVGSSSLSSKTYMFKEMYLGWGLIAVHTILPNFIFLFLYLHMFKSLFFPIYSVLKLWISGVVILIFFMMMVFTGYSLVSSSMGYWALVVICELIFFMFGEDFSNMVLFSSEMGISEFVFYKMYTMHYLSSIMVLIFILTHIFYLHKFGSSNNNFSYCGSISFSTILLLKDFYLSIFLVMLLVISIFFTPEIFLTGDGSIPGASKDYVEMSVVWYLSMFFMLLSSVDNKFLGVIFMCILVLLILFNLFFKSLWGISESLFSSAGMMVSMVLMGVSFYFFGSSVYSMSVVLLFLQNMFLESLLNIFYFYSYLPMSK